jgi:hypothetical protein
MNAPMVPEPDVIDGAGLLDDVRQFLARFVAFPSEDALTAVALWCAHTHLVDAADSTPRLALLSPEPGSGKTRTLEVLELLVPNPMNALNGSPAPIFRSIESDRPVLLMDEVDAVFGRAVKSDDPAADLRALINAGHRKGATIPRCVGPQHDVRRFPVYAAVALAGLGDLPDTLMSRSLIVRMRRRAPDERVEPFRYRLHAGPGHGLRDQLADWAGAVAETVADAWPELPEGVTDRPADCWEPLLAVADAAGGHWPVTGRSACLALCRASDDRGVSLGVRLLTDLRTVWTVLGNPAAVSTHDLLDSLHELDEAPWSNLKGQPLDSRGLARLLRGYEVRSDKVWTGAKTLQGYKREDLWDAWQRYCPAPLPGTERPEGTPDPPESGGSQLPFAGELPEGAGLSGRKQASESGGSGAPSVPSANPSGQCAAPADAWTLMDTPGRENEHQAKAGYLTGLNDQHLAFLLRNADEPTVQLIDDELKRRDQEGGDAA